MNRSKVLARFIEAHVDDDFDIINLCDAIVDENNEDAIKMFESGVDLAREAGNRPICAVDTGGLILYFIGSEKEVLAKLVDYYYSDEQSIKKEKKLQKETSKIL